MVGSTERVLSQQYAVHTFDSIGRTHRAKETEDAHLQPDRKRKPLQHPEFVQPQRRLTVLKKATDRRFTAGIQYLVLLLILQSKPEQVHGQQKISPSLGIEPRSPA